MDDFLNYASTTEDALGAPCTITVTDIHFPAITVCSGVTKFLENSQPIIIKSISNTGTRSATPLQVACDNLTVYLSWNNGQQDFLNIPCDGDLGWNYQSGQPTDDHFIIVNWVYASENMATATPFTSYQSWDNGILYSYSPIQALIGILLLLSVFSIFVFGIIKIFAKR